MSRIYFFIFGIKIILKSFLSVYSKNINSFIEKNLKINDLIKFTEFASNTLSDVGKDKYIFVINLELIRRVMNLSSSDILKFMEV